MADERRSSAADEVHDDDELAEAMAAELERYATGVVPIVRAQPAPAPVAPTVVAAQGREPEAETSFRRRPPAPEPYVPSPAAPPTGPVRRRSGFLHPEPPTPPAEVDPAERVLPTVPTPLPEVTVSLLDSMIAESSDGTPRRHRARHAEPDLPPVTEIEDPLRSTGPLALPRGLYEDWEQSLRSIGRPRQDWDDQPIVAGSGADAPTVALQVQKAESAPRVEAAAPPEPQAVDAGPIGTTRRRVRRHAAPESDPPGAPVTGETPTPPDAIDDDLAAGAVDDAVDELPVEHPQVSAATTGAVDLPSVEPRPRTAPVLIERVRTAILQLPEALPSATGSGGGAVAGRWFGAFASPVMVLAGFALAGSGAGPAGTAALALGLLLALPAAARGAARVIALPADGDSLERDVFGRRGATIAGAVLLVARLAAAIAALLAVGNLAGAFAARTGVLGGSSSAAMLGGVLAAGLAAIAVAVWPPRVTAVLVLVLAAIGVVVTALVLLVLGRSAAPSPATAAGIAAAAVAGFALIGLPLVLAGPDIAGWRTAVATPWRTAVGAVVGGVAAVVVVLLAVGAGAGATGTDAAGAFADAVTDATAAPLAGPLAIALIAGSITLPALLLRSAGGAAARLLGRGRSDRLGALACGLLALAGALGLVAIGTDLGAALAVIAATAGVPVAAWAGVLTLAPFRGRGAGPLAIGALIATAVGWLLADGVGFAGERSPVLAALGGVSAPWGGGPAIGLALAFAVGAASAGIARAAGSGPERDGDAGSLAT